MRYENISIERLSHASFKITGTKIVYVDPYKLFGDFEKADLVIITHNHFDHCSVSDVKKISGDKTIIVTVPDCQSKLSGVEARSVTLVRPGDIVELFGLRIEAVPAYNLNKSFHPKENEWIGVVLTIDGVRIYHAGDTDLIPEMSSLKNIDVALLPVSGTYVMTAEEAVQAVKLINPKLAIPMHYGSVVGTKSDAEKFKEQADCRVELI
ncbi:MAG: MBL fold metallo-hydrolase [Nanoarchaeota archaeon]|nr:MBL fold metallo-hydrolase [Nanoarchaeota archaeon]MBU1030399.1 MBL fold metallo-hydrolase [Nanoarchaeota archaeon]MBU1850021.1 MBL fold metallo-hydrolase [Nanoarchaeota archaeon]